MSTSTNFLNSKQRRIFQSARGAFFARSGDKKFYKPVAAFRKAGGEGATVKLVRGNASVPLAIRSKVRAVRKNKGVARGPREGVVQRRMNVQAVRAAAKGPRKVRKNKGVKRVVRRTPMNHGPNQGALLRKMWAKKPARAPKRVPMNHGPNQGRLQRLMNTASRRAANRRAANRQLAQNPFAALR
jgi:hypothetical protein